MADPEWSVSGTSEVVGGGMFPGAAGGKILWRSWPVERSKRTVLIAHGVSDFQPVFDDADAAGKVVQTTLTFAPIFRRSASSDARPATTLTSRAVMRNH